MCVEGKRMLARMHDSRDEGGEIKHMKTEPRRGGNIKERGDRIWRQRKVMHSGDKETRAETGALIEAVRLTLTHT